MALEFIVEDINTVPEAFRGEYTEKDGKFHLAVNGLETTYVPRSAFERSNRENAERRNALKPWETLAGGRTAEEIGTIIADFDAGKFNKGKTKEEFDQALAAHKTQTEKQIGDLTKDRDTAYGIARRAVVDGGLKGALAKNKATAEGLALLPKILGERIELKFENGEPVQRILGADGKSPMIGTGQDGFATLDDLMKEVVKTYPSLFEGSGAGGGGSPVKTANGGGEKVLSRTEFDALSPPEKSKKMREGFKVVD